MYQIQKATYNKIQQHIIKEKKKNLLFFSPLQPSQHILEKDIKYRMVRKTQSSSLLYFIKLRLYHKALILWLPIGTLC